jgi:hypothetical protein
VVEPAIDTIKSAIEPTRPIEPIITELTEEINDIITLDNNLMEINETIEAQIVETLQNMNNSLYALTATEVEETLDYFTNSLNNRLKYEQELFYQSESISGGANPADENDTYDIKNILDRYYYNIQGSHIKLFIDTYISAIDNADDDITETVDIIKNIENIYRYVLSIYPENVYDFLYTKQFLDMKSLPTPMETDVLVNEETSRPTPMDTLVVEDLPISSTPTSTLTSMDTDVPTQSAAVLTPQKKPLKEIYTSNKLKTLNDKFKSASTKKNSIKSIKSVKQKTENKENQITANQKTAKRKRGETSSEGNTAKRKKETSSKENTVRRSLFFPPSRIEVGGSKKRTRKYKKYNKIKKTQQNRKKTRKNKTLKKRKEKRNYRTRRN